MKKNCLGGWGGGGMSVEQSRMFYSRLEHSRTVHQLVTADHLRPPEAA